MSSFNRKIATVSLVFALSAVSALLASEATPATVGDFLQTTARLSHLDAGSPAAAAAALRAAGHAIPALPLDRALTQGDVVAMAQTLGLNVTTSTPDAAFDGDELDQFFTVFAGDLSGGGNDAGATTQGNPDPPSGVDPTSKGKGKKKGLFKSPTDPVR